MSRDKPTVSPFDRSAQHDTKRAAILSQAARLFNSKGSRATTLQDIASTLGLTKTSLYYYVKTKEELIYQCYMAALQHHLHKMDTIESQHAQPLARAKAFFISHFEDWLAARESRAPYIAALLEIASLKGPHRQEVEAIYTQMFKRLRQYLRDGIADESFRELETTSTTRAILGSVDWAFSWLHQVPAGRVGAVAEEAFDLLSRGLSAGQREYHPEIRAHQKPSGAYVKGFDREEQNRLKQQAFYKTGTWFFNRQGFNGTSLDEIAEHLNVSKGAFYYHIKNKEDLLFHCYTYSQAAVRRIHEEALHQPCSGLGRLAYICREVFRVQNSDDGPLIRYNTITALP
ncbi:MAG: TetR/AcrR family transcriptional regulator, partial [Parahaliea sp.]